MSNLIATKRVDLLAPYLALDQGPKVMAECESLSFSLSRVCGGWCEYGIVEVRGGVYAVSGYDEGMGKITVIRPNYIFISRVVRA
jgi:hypothetical protein